MFENLNRRSFLNLSVATSGLGVLGATAAADVPAGQDPFDYEVTRTDDEWRALLGEEDYAILRLGRTERQRSSPLWAETRDGTYSCKGCDLLQYTSVTKAFPGKGWVFFTASEPNSQMMSQDIQGEMGDEVEASDIFIEVHCRRCGSHIGHILLVNGDILHCINGASLTFEPAA